MIKITGDKGKIDITFDDKIVRFYGDLCTRYFLCNS